MTVAAETTSVLQGALQTVIESAECRRVIDEIQRGARVISISGMVAAPARALAVAGLPRATGKQFAVVVPAQRDLESWERDLGFWYCALHGTTECEDALAVLPASESDPYAGASPHAETLERRALALWRLARRKQDLVLLTTRAMARRTVAPAEVLQAGAMLRRDEDTAPEQLVEKLSAGGYVREEPLSAIRAVSIPRGNFGGWPPGRHTPPPTVFFRGT